MALILPHHRNIDGDKNKRATCQLKFTVEGTKRYILFQQNNTQKIKILFNKYIIYDKGPSQ